MIVPLSPLEVHDGDRDRPVIVCGIDGSEPGEGALTAAIALAQRSGHELAVVHVADLASPRAAIPGVGAAPVSTGHAALVDRQREAVERLLSRAEHASRRHAVTVTTRTVPGDPPAVLEQVAADERATLIVVGSRGRAASGAALLGSTSMSLVGSAARPVMVVPPGGQQWLERAATGGRA